MGRLVLLFPAFLAAAVALAEMHGSFPEGKGQAAVVADAEKLTVTITRFHGRKESRVARMTRHDEAVYKDDSADVFIGVPGRRDFVHIIANTLGAVYDEHVDENRRSDVRWNSGAKASGSYDDKTDSFTVRIEIPLSAIAPPDGRITLCCGAHVHYQLESAGCWGTYFRPETFAAFQTPWRRPPPKVEEPSVFPGVGELAEDRRTSMLEVTRRSDIVWKGEPMRYAVKVHEPQVEPVEIEIIDGKAVFRYKDEKVEIPYRTDDSPWEK